MQDNYTNDLLEFKDQNIIVTDFHKEGKIRNIYIEYLKREQRCPNCGCKTSRVHDYRTRIIKHQCSMGYHDIIHYRRRRYMCSHCGKKFAETNNIVAKYGKISYHTKKLIIHEYRLKQSIKDIGFRLNISFHTVMRYINLFFKTRRLKLPEVISIDEFKNLKNGYGKYAFIMVDPINHKLIDLFPNRRKDNLIKHFSKIPIEERLNVKIVIADLWDPYRKLVKLVFPNARLIADKYHFLRQLYWGLNDIRLRVMRNYPKKSIEKHLLKKHWKMINKYTYNLSPNHFYDYKLKYHVTPRQIIEMVRAIHPDIKAAIDLKDEFYEILHTSDSEHIQDDLHVFINKLWQSGLEEYRTVAKTYTNWFNGICNSFIDSNYTNGFIEGLNNMIKVIKRIAFGYRNFDNFKSRIFALTTNDLPLSYAY